MASGSFYSYPVKNFGLYCTWESTPDAENNQSKVTLKTYLSYYTLTAISQTATTSINGSSKSFTAPAINVSSASAWTKKLINTRTETIKHNGDGTKQIVLTASYPFNGKYSGISVGTITASKTVSLDNIKTKCTAPTVFTITSDKGGNNAFETNLTLEWSGAKAGVGNSIAGYQILYATSSDNATWNYANLQKITSTSTSGKITLDMSSKVARGNYVCFRIQTLSSEGSSYYSTYTNSASIRRQPYTKCTAPTSFTATNLTADSASDFKVSLAWSGASGGTANPIASYYIWYTTSINNSTWDSWTAIPSQPSISSSATSGSTTVDLATKVANGYYVKFRIEVRGSAGSAYYSAYKETSSIRRNPYTNCIAPTTITLISDRTGQPFENNITVQWSGGNKGVNNNITAYLIRYTTSVDNQTWQSYADLATITTSSTSGSQSFNISAKVSRGHYVKIAIQTIGSVSGYDSAWAYSATLQRNPYTKCVSPTSFMANSHTSNGIFEDEVTLTWSGASNGSSNPIQSYAIQYRVASTQNDLSKIGWSNLTTVNTTASSGSTTVQVASRVERGYYIEFAISTQGSAGISFNSDFVLSNVCQRDTLYPVTNLRVYSHPKFEYSMGEPIVLLWSGRYKRQTYCEVEARFTVDDVWGDWNFVKAGYGDDFGHLEISDISDMVDISNIAYEFIPDNTIYQSVPNRQKIQFRVRTKSPYGVYSHYVESDVLVRIDNTGICLGLNNEWIPCEVFWGVNGKFVDCEVYAGVDGEWKPCSATAGNSEVVALLKVDDPTYYFDDNDLTYLTELPMLNTSDATDFTGMCQSCEYITTIPLYNTSKGVYFVDMFNGCYMLETIPLLDTSQAEDMNFMFYDCTALTTLPLLNTSNNLDFSYMFSHCEALETIPQFDTSKGTNFNSMFSYCDNFKTLPLLDMSSAENVSSMFASCNSLTTIPALDLGNVTNFGWMFSRCASLKTVPSLNTCNGSYFAGMFEECTNLETIGEIDFSGYNADGWGDLDRMFYACTNLVNVTFKPNSLKLNKSYVHNTQGIFGNSNNISVESLVSFLNALQDNTGGTRYTITLPTSLYNKLSAEQLAIATNKNITIAKPSY